MKLERLNTCRVMVSEPIYADQFDMKAASMNEYIHIFDRLRQDYDLDYVDPGLRFSYDDVYTTLTFASDLKGVVSDYETKDKTMFFRIVFPDVGSTNRFCEQLELTVRHSCGPL